MQHARARDCETATRTRSVVGKGAALQLQACADAGWWRTASFNTSGDALVAAENGTLDGTLFNCYDEVLCLGSTGNNLSDAAPAFDKQCLAGHTGPVCALCEDGYMRQGGACAECPPFNAPNVIGVVALVFAVAAALAAPKVAALLS